jgi:hypothetical protein
MPKPRKPYFKVRNSRIHGRGAFATRRIRKATRVIEYTGERITNEEAERRYRGRNDPHDHTVLFALDKRTCLDAGRHGNEARFINHSCHPNCETVHDKGRIFIQAIRNIQPGVELSYEYELTGPKPRTKGEWARYACHCDVPHCRGTMLAISPPKKRRASRKTKFPRKIRKS